MAQHSPDRSFGPDAEDELRDLPLDPDVDAREDRRHRSDQTAAAPLRRQRRGGWPRIHWQVVAMVALGAFPGGIARYAATLAWPARAGAFPWSIFGVNTIGAFILALLLVIVFEVLPPSTYLRPALGTGFCGALTTFSSVATGADQLAAHGHLSLAVGYVVVSVVAGLAAASFGLVTGRSIAANREKGRE